MKSKLPLFGLGLFLGVVALWAGFILIDRPYTFRGSAIEPPVPMKDFSLIDQYGQKFTLREQDGKVVLVFFGYTHCPDVCPVTLAEFTRIKQELGSEASQVRFVYITVDPERDTVPVMHSFMTNFDADFLALTETRENLEVVWSNFGVYQSRQESNSAGGYLVDHTARTYLLDQNGSLVATYPYEMTEADVVADVRHLISRGQTQ